MVDYNYLNVVDLESSCWEYNKDYQARESEIIEIGITEIDVINRVRMTKYSIYVRPDHSIISEFCTNLTGITQRQVDMGVSLHDALTVLMSVYFIDERPWASWGEYDHKMLVSQCMKKGISYDFHPEHYNAKAIFAESRGHKRQVGMAKALEMLNMPLEGKHHSGMWDSWNIAAIVLYLMNKGDWPNEG